MQQTDSTILFIVNPGSGNQKTDWKKEIVDFFSQLPQAIVIKELPNPCNPAILKKIIEDAAPSKVVAVGGDGTVKLLAQCLLGSSIPLGILPAGSANGMARELGIPAIPAEALEVVVHGDVRAIHLTKINQELCIHLSDIGFNAFVVKKFEETNTRGMWGYIKAAFKVLWQNQRMKVRMQTDTEDIVRDAAMVVIANATTYGNGVVINPAGSLYDDLFEVVIIKKISFTEIFKMRFTRRSFNPDKTELFQTRSLHIQSRHRVHFQVDGETMGKIKEIQASILPTAIRIIAPQSIATG